MRKDETPEFIDLKEEYQYNVNLYHRAKGLRERQEHHRTLYEQTVDLGLKGRDFQNPTYTPDAMLIVDDPADHLAQNKILVDQEPRASKQGVKTKAAEAQSDKCASWMQKLLDINKQNEPYFYREIVHNLCYWGEAFPKLDIHWDTIGDPEQFPGLPMEIVVPNSIMVYASMNLKSGVPDSIFWERVTTVGHVLDQLEEWNVDKNIKLSVGSKKDSDLIYFIEWYKGKWMGYLVADRTQLIPDYWLEAVPFEGNVATENPLGHPPFIRVYSGLGTSSPDGDPVYPVRGILTGIERVLIGKSRTYTKIDTITSKHALPIPKYTMEDETLPLPRVDLSAGGGVKVGKVNLLDVTYLLPPPIPDAQIQQAIEQDKILENYRPSVTRGVPIPGEPASSLATRLGLAVIKWTPIETSSIKAVSRMCEMALEVVDIAGKYKYPPIEIGGVALRAEDVNGYYRADIDVEPGSQEQLRFDIFTALQLWEKIPNRVWIVTNFLHQKNATQFLLDLDTDVAWKELLTDPTYKAAFYAGVFEKKGMTEEIQRLTELIKQGMLPGPGQGEANFTNPEETLPPTATPAGAGGSPELGVASLPGTHQQPVANLAQPTVELRTEG